MQKNQIHILNGDALKENFPGNIPGKIIVMRECLVDGSVEGENLEKLYATRAKFISANYEGYGEEEYFKHTVPEIEKINSMPNNSEVFLWFEEDLFCQVNLWFVLSILSKNKHSGPIHLVLPDSDNKFGFASMNGKELHGAFQNKLEIDFEIDLPRISKLWQFYQKNQYSELLKIARELYSKFPFLAPAVQAHLERNPKGGGFGRPDQTIIEIMQELKTTEFAPIFKEFNKRELIYGFGDLQVKRIIREIQTNK